MEFTEVEVRVLGCLIEKRATTPDQYPLSTNALNNACNQKSSREPVMALSDREVLAAMMELRAAGVCRSATSGRTDKHKHVLDESWGLNEAQLAALAIMLLRGPQTPGEIRTRTDRYVTFGSLEEVESTLRGLAEPTNQGRQALVVDLGRGPGQSQNRWMHLLAGEPAADALANANASAAAGASPGQSRSSKVEALEQRVALLEERIARLEGELGLDPVSADDQPTDDQMAHDQPVDDQSADRAPEEGNFLQS